jgi:hypothetical protein
LMLTVMNIASGRCYGSCRASENSTHKRSL